MNGEKMKNLQRLDASICGSLALVVLLIAFIIPLSIASAIGQPVVIQVSKPLPTAVSKNKQNPTSSSMDAQTIGHIIALSLGVIGIIISTINIFASRSQAEKDRAFNQKQAQEDRQHQSRPILVPKRELTHTIMLDGETPYIHDGTVDWWTDRHVDVNMKILPKHIPKHILFQLEFGSLQ
jgi:hypothetical protein